MALQKRGKYYYGDSQSDIRQEITRLSAEGYLASEFADAVCRCGGKLFHLRLDEAQGWRCESVRPAHEHPIGDSDEFLAQAELDDCVCVCDGDQFEITVGVALYDDSEDVKWLYVGCRCPSCGITGVYGDWKNEFNGYRELLARV